MYLTTFHLLCLLFTNILAVYYEGEHCQTENKNGTCVSINKCSYAKKLLQVRRRPQHCGFQNQIPIVCCPNIRSEAETVAGIKSNKKCEEYRRQRGPPRPPFYLGIPSLATEFPHMALLGYGEVNNTKWLCGGSLISEYFIVTAAHCLSSGNLGNINKVRLGELNTNTTSDDANPEDYGVSEKFPHPEYNPSSHYNDIALLKLDRKANMNGYVFPACLHTGYVPPPSSLIGTGWGKTDFVGESSSHLLKADLNKLNHTMCANSYSNISTRRLKYGILDEIQICAGSANGTDACEGDSGGPLQFKVWTVWNELPYYVIVGIVSFGKACGLENSVGVYTRVAPYLGWIENIVWS